MNTTFGKVVPDPVLPGGLKALHLKPDQLHAIPPTSAKDAMLHHGSGLEVQFFLAGRAVDIPPKADMRSQEQESIEGALAITATDSGFLLPAPGF
jgi:hypothetical protein